MKVIKSIFIISIILCICFLNACSTNTAIEMPSTSDSLPVVEIPTTQEETSPLATEITLETVVGTVAEDTKIEEVEIRGVDCYKVGVVSTPKAFGKPELSEAEMNELLSSGDINTLSNAINTLPDALIFMEAYGFQEGPAETAEELLKTKKGVIPLSELFIDLLKDNLVLGMLNGVESSDKYIIVEQEGVYYPVELVNLCFWHFNDINELLYTYADKDPEQVIESLKKHIGEEKATNVSFIMYEPTNVEIVNSVSAEASSSEESNSARLMENYVVEYPEVFGQPCLSDAEIIELTEINDVDELSDRITTVPDALNYFAQANFSEGGNGGRSIEEILTTHKGKPSSFTDLMLHLLAGDYEMGKITLEGNGSSYVLPCVCYEDVWYPLDVFSLIKRQGNENQLFQYANTDVLAVVDGVRNSGIYRENESGTFAESTIRRKSVAERNARKYLKERKLSDAELEAFIATSPSLEEAAAKLTTAADAFRFLQLSGFRFDYSYNHHANVDGRGWGWVLSAQFVYDHMAGSCGGIADVMNALLAGDYDTQGYVRYVGEHIFNYVVTNGVYCFLDFTPQLAAGVENESYGKADDWFLGAYEEPLQFTEDYTEQVFPTEWNDPSAENYMRFMFLTEGDGKNACAMSGDGMNYMVLPESENITVLYVRDGCSIRTVPFDSDANRPSEDNIPDDEHWDFRTGTYK